MHMLAKRDSDTGTIVPVVVVVAIIAIIGLISWIRIVRARERRLFHKPTYWASSNPIGRVKRYEPSEPEPRRPRTPPALRPRTENTYVRRPEPAARKPNSKNKPTDSAQPTPPLYRSQVPTPERAASLSNAPGDLDGTALPRDMTQVASFGVPAAHTRLPATQELPPPPYNKEAQ